MNFQAILIPKWFGLAGRLGRWIDLIGWLSVLLAILEQMIFVLFLLSLACTKDRKIFSPAQSGKNNFQLPIVRKTATRCLWKIIHYENNDHSRKNASTLVSGISIQARISVLHKESAGWKLAVLFIITETLFPSKQNFPQNMLSFFQNFPD